MTAALRWLWTHRASILVSALLFSAAYLAGILRFLHAGNGQPGLISPAPLPLLRWLGLGFLGLLGLLGLAAWRHARAMTCFQEGIGPPLKLEQLSLPETLRVLFNGARVARPGLSRFPDQLGLTYEVHRFPGPEDSLEAWYIPHPLEKGIVLLFHGYGVSKSILLPEASTLHQMGYSCFLVDFRGSGGSSGETTTIGYREAGDVIHSLDYVRKHWPGRPTILHGVSMGSTAILRAMTHPGARVDGLILESPFDRLLNTIKARVAAVGAPVTPFAHLMLVCASVQQRFNGFAHNPSDYAASVTVPTLVMVGEEDPWVSLEDIQRVYQALRGPRKLVTFAGVGHESLVEGASKRWKESVKAFLDSLSLQARSFLAHGA